VSSVLSFRIKHTDKTNLIWLSVAGWQIVPKLGLLPKKQDHIRDHHDENHHELGEN
jgi:hypothetical protein